MVTTGVGPSVQGEDAGKEKNGGRERSAGGEATAHGCGRLNTRAAEGRPAAWGKNERVQDVGRILSDHGGGREGQATADERAG